MRKTIVLNIFTAFNLTSRSQEKMETYPKTLIPMTDSFGLRWGKAKEIDRYKFSSYDTVNFNDGAVPRTYFTLFYNNDSTGSYYYHH